MQQNPTYNHHPAHDSLLTTCRAPLTAITLTDLDWLQQVKVALPSAPSLPACGLAPAALASLDWKRSTPPHTSSAVQQGQGQEQELFLARFEGTLTVSVELY